MSDLLPILAIESSGELCSVCIMEDENTFWEVNAKKKYIHSEKIFLMIDSLFNLADLKVPDLKSIAVSMGPGSFIQTWYMAGAIPLGLAILTV